MAHKSFWPGDDIPRFVRARYYISVAVSLVLGLLLVALPFFGDRGFPYVHVPLMLLIPAAAVILWNRWRTRRETSRALNGVPLCWGCGYDLTATPSPGRCPECGDSFNAADLREKWKRMTFR